MSQYARMPAQYVFEKTREDGVPIYRKIEDPIVGGGFLPMDISYSYVRPSVETEGFYTIRNQINTDPDLYPGSLRFAQNSIEENTPIVKAMAQEKKKAFIAECANAAIGVTLATVFLASSIPLGHKAELATQNAMKDPAVIQRAENRAWDKALKEERYDKSEKIQNLQRGETLSFTIGGESTLKLRDKFRGELLETEAKGSTILDDLHAFMGIFLPASLGSFGFLSLMRASRTASQEKRLRKIKTENDKALETITTALGRTAEPMGMR